MFRRLLSGTLALAFLGSASWVSAAPAITRPTVVEGGLESDGGLPQAGAAGAVLALPGGARIRASAGTVFKLFRTPQQLALDPGPKTTSWTVTVRAGRLDVVVPEKQNRYARTAVLVTAPRQVTTISKGGETNVIVDDEDVVVANRRGQLLAGTGSRWTPVAEGSARVFASKAPDGAERALVGSVTFEPTSSVFVAAKSRAQVGSFAWKGLEGASTYQVSLVAADGGRVLQSTTTAEPRVDHLGPLEPGNYELTVRAVDSYGLESSAVSQKRLQVLGIELPPGSFAASDGSIQVGEGQRVRFTNVDGLEMTYKGAAHFVPASESVGLYRNQPTVVIFRRPGSHDMVHARLSPRTLKAEVRVGPKFVKWPTDPVEVEVRLTDTEGQPIPDWLEVIPTVTLGIDPIAVDWKREGRVLRATIPPNEEKKGPWVLRVEVADQYGVPLGRDFVEIVEDKSKVVRVAEVKQ